jgi:hypothetical protein
MKVGQWDRAASDFTKAISLQLGNAILLMSIDQFRAMYPEYGSASNELVARKLQQTFLPDLGYDNFVKDFFSRPFMPSTTIPDLILKRSDAYLKLGNWHRAAIDFQRATKGFPEYGNTLDRWRGIDKADPSSAYVDLKTFDDVKRGSVKVWMKFVRAGADVTSDYALQRYEVNCTASQLRLVSLATYAAGNAVSQQDRQTSQWTSACRSN